MKRKIEILFFSLTVLLLTMPVRVSSAPSVPKTTAGGDPVNVVSTGLGWSSAVYDFLLSKGWHDAKATSTYHGETFSVAYGNDFGTRYHLRIWGDYYDPEWGHWSYGNVHKEVFVGPPQWHKIVSWEEAEAYFKDVYASAGKPQYKFYSAWLENSGYYQDYYNDGYATRIHNDGTGDVNRDGVVNILDAAALSAHWYPGPPIGPLGFDPNFDINGDGNIDIVDVSIVSACWTG